MRRICVFAGSSLGSRASYAALAERLGSELARRGLGMVYGGARVGLMGVAADAALAAGGEVLGVIPRGLFRREVAHTGITHLYEVATMHERKARMAELADGFIALPGGYGTCDELFEIVTWAQIGLHSKPIGLLDCDDFFAPLLAFVRNAVAEGFIPPSNQDLLLRATDPATLLDRMRRYVPAARLAASVEPPPQP